MSSLLEKIGHRSPNLERGTNLLIGLSGHKGSGKDTVGAYLSEKYGLQRVAFADPMKVSVAALFGISVADINTFKDDPGSTVRITVGGAGKGFTLREFLQRYGTEAHRDIFGEMFWIEQMMNMLDDDKSYVVTDARFPNERAAIRELGGRVFDIVRPGLDSNDAHVTEKETPASEVDSVIVNDGSFEDLYRRVEEALEYWYGRSA